MSYDIARAKALELLGRRDFSEKELLDKLLNTYGFREEAAEDAVGFVVECGYIDDKQYAEKLAELLIKVKRKGFRAARYEMSRKGLSNDIITDALAEYDRDDFREQIALFLEKYDVSDERDRRRAASALARRGFDFSDINYCIKNALEHSEDLEDLGQEEYE